MILWYQPIWLSIISPVGMDCNIVSVCIFEYSAKYRMTEYRASSRLMVVSFFRTHPSTSILPARLFKGSVPVIYPLNKNGTPFWQSRFGSNIVNNFWLALWELHVAVFTMTVYFVVPIAIHNKGSLHRWLFLNYHILSLSDNPKLSKLRFFIGFFGNNCHVMNLTLPSKAATW